MNNQNFNINNIDKEYINQLCREWNLSEFSIFGSFADNSANNSSDVDVLIDFKKDYKASLFDLIKLQNKLEVFFKTKVDLLTLNGVAHSNNEFRKQEILNNRIVLYESR